MTERRVTPLPPGWSRLRKAILNRDHHTCNQCGEPGTHVDHIRPAAEGGTDNPDNLQTLCAKCHNHKTGQDANRLQTQRRALEFRQPEPHPGLTTQGR